MSQSSGGWRGWSGRTGPSKCNTGKPTPISCFLFPVPCPLFPVLAACFFACRGISYWYERNRVRVSQEGDGGFVAECLTEAIFTEADNWEELRRKVKEAVAAYYFDQAKPPAAIRLRLVRDEVFANG